MEPVLHTFNVTEYDEKERGGEQSQRRALLKVIKIIQNVRVCDAQKWLKL